MIKGGMVTKVGKSWTKLAKSCPKLAKVNKNWQKLAKDGKSWQKLPTIVKSCQKVVKQDHLRWRYSTVIHWEQLVYLAIWKDLNKGKI